MARWLPAETDLHPAGFVTSLVRASSFGFSANVGIDSTGGHLVSYPGEDD